MDLEFKTDLRAVIFDFDGVINDSGGPGLERIIEIVAAAGHAIPQDIRQRLNRLWGTHGTKLIETAFDLDNKTSQDLYKEWKKIDATQFFPLVADAKKTLAILKEEMNLKISMLTSRNRQNLMDVMNHYDLSGLFDAIQCRDDYAFVKPDPRVFDYILNLLDTPKNSCLYVGDTLGDWQSTAGTDIRFVGVETGLLKRSDWQALGLDSKNILQDIGWLPVWILKHF